MAGDLHARSAPGWKSAIKKTLRQIEGEADYTVHFRYGPDTAVVIPDEGTAPIDCCYNAMLSMRSSGEYARTTHDISRGDMKAVSGEGQRTFTRLNEVEIR
ncbi:hypothetical protein [Paracoccus sp. S1E-3]|uniref:hypothetical protein n=1 Tax=Paracoccus sp. S1E-3 TaxID=2756130 RepID=UPI0015EE6E8F|nr:hypothetical protein [Paracoccus sp. S1E-3]MBA4492038.1 hypothetical protein [Paracoccus sp. S1E-3]